MKHMFMDCTQSADWERGISGTISGIVREAQDLAGMTGDSVEIYHEDGVIVHLVTPPATVTVINKTPHPVHIVDKDGTIIHTYPAVADPIRLAVTTEDRGVLSDGTPLAATVFGEPVGLPTYRSDTMIIVSQIVQSACADRADLLIPADVQRDADGNIIGCRALGVRP